MLDNSVAFKRGATFTFLLQLPDTVAEGQFTGWTPRSQIRRQEDTAPSGFLAELVTTWEDPLTAKMIRIHHAGDTAGWPLGLAEVDVVILSPEGVKVYSETLLFDIQRQVTE